MIKKSIVSVIGVIVVVYLFTILQSENVEGISPEGLPCISVTICTPQFPDLVIDNIDVEVTKIGDNESGNKSREYSATVFMTVRNQGALAVKEEFTRTEMVVSTFTPRKIYTPALGPGESIVISNTFTIVVEGFYNVTGFADVLFTVDEGPNGEDNNDAASTFTVP